MLILKLNKYIVNNYLKVFKSRKQTLSTKKVIKANKINNSIIIRDWLRMFVLSKIFGECPQVKLLEVLAENFDEELSIPDILWLTDIPKTTIYNYVNRLLDEKILLKGSKVGKTQFYHLNNEKEEVKIVLSLVNHIVSEKLAEKLEEKGLKKFEEHEIESIYLSKKVPSGNLFMESKSYSQEMLDSIRGIYRGTIKMTKPKYERGVYS